MERAPRLRPIPLALVLALATSAIVPAAPATAAPGGFDTHRFQPSPHPFDILAVRTSAVGESMHYGFGFLLHYSADPLVFQWGPAEQQAVDASLVADLFVSLAVFDWLDVAIGLPIHIVNEGTSGPLIDTSAMPSAGIGDLRIAPKFRILDAGRGGLGIGAELVMFAPTGADGGFMREDNFVLMPRFILDYVWLDGKIRLAFNAAYKSRLGMERDLFFTNPVDATAAPRKAMSLGEELWFGLGAVFRVYKENLDLLIETEAATGIDAFFTDANTHYLELRGGVRYVTDRGLGVLIGAGTGLLDGYGSPSWRVFAGLTYSPRDVVYDADGDGVTDDVDRCPTEKEDPDAYEDYDGCPDLDNDADGVADDEDFCPVDAEDPDGFQDDDGCPEPDNDGDGVPDLEDRCADQPEDPDGFEDDDGCPDPDNDRDGIPDDRDACPLAPENVNGCQDEDGCPEEGRVCVGPEKLTIAEKIHFKTARATILPESFPILDELAQTLLAHPWIKKVRVDGHTDDRGSESKNLRLSAKRARAVVTYLVRKGVPRERLSFEGFGESMPIAPNDTPEGRAQNRRVEFTILEQDPPPAPEAPAPAPVPTPAPEPAPKGPESTTE